MVGVVLLLLLGLMLSLLLLLLGMHKRHETGVAAAMKQRSGAKDALPKDSGEAKPPPPRALWEKEANARGTTAIGAAPKKEVG